MAPGPGGQDGVCLSLVPLDSVSLCSLFPQRPLSLDSVSLMGVGPGEQTREEGRTLGVQRAPVSCLPALPGVGTAPSDGIVNKPGDVGGSLVLKASFIFSFLFCLPPFCFPLIFVCFLRSFFWTSYFFQLPPSLSPSLPLFLPFFFLTSCHCLPPFLACIAVLLPGPLSLFGELSHVFGLPFLANLSFCVEMGSGARRHLSSLGDIPEAEAEVRLRGIC